MIRLVAAAVVGLFLVSEDVSAQSELDWLVRFQVKFGDLSPSECFDELEDIRATLLSPDQVPADHQEAAAVMNEAIQKNCEFSQSIALVVQKQKQLNTRMQTASLTRDQAQTDARFVYFFEELFVLEHTADGFRNSANRLFLVAYNMDPGLQDDWLWTLVGGQHPAGG